MVSTTKPQVGWTVKMYFTCIWLLCICPKPISKHPSEDYDWSTSGEFNSNLRCNDECWSVVLPSRCWQTQQFAHIIPYVLYEQSMLQISKHYQGKGSLLGLFICLFVIVGCENCAMLQQLCFSTGSNPNSSLLAFLIFKKMDAAETQKETSLL